MSEELSPRQIDFLKNYLDPSSETYSDAKNSALKAGYSEEYANNITALYPNWLSDSIGQKRKLVEKAEKKLDVFLDSEDEKIAQDTTKFVLKTLGKNEGYSEKTEMEHKGEINVNHIDEEQAIRIIKRRIAGATMPVEE